MDISPSWLLVSAILLLAGCDGHQVPAPIARIKEAPIPSFDHVFLIVEENENYANVIGNAEDMPYLNTLASKYGVATNYFANVHPSINNYFLLTAGRMGTYRPWIRDLSDTFPFTVHGDNVASILSAKGKSWKAYAENLPGSGYIGDDRFPYVKRHNPFSYFASVRGSASQRRNIVPFEQFRRDLEANTLPDYSFIVPNLYHDGHHDQLTKHTAPCGDHKALQAIDAWLNDRIRPLIESDTFQRSGLLIVVFDEACEYGPKADWRFDPKAPDRKGGGQVAAIIVSSRTPAGSKSDKLYHHESVLRLTLRALGIEQLPGEAERAPDMDAFFR
jgi:acid phosphatase